MTTTVEALNFRELGSQHPIDIADQINELNE